MTLPPSAPLVVIGAGAIGASVALALALDGRDVLLLDRGAVGQGATAGTACLVTASHAERMASPAALREGLRSLPDPAGPFSLRPSLGALTWLARFSAASLDRDGARAGTDLLIGLALESLALHRSWSAAHDTGLVERGVLNAYLTPGGLEAALPVARHLATLGLAPQVLDAAGVAAREPAVLGAIGGIWYPGDCHLDSLVFAQRVAAAASGLGAVVVEDVEVHQIRAEGATVRLDTSRGDLVAEQVVVATGAAAPALASDLGLRLPIAPAKGYHVEHAGAAPALAVPTFLAETRVVATPLPGRVRLAGTLEIGTPVDKVDLRRVDAIARAGADHIAGLAGSPRTAVWHGLRPMSADGMPMLGPVPGSSRVLVAVGHGMLGVTLAPITAQVVARLVAGERPPERLRPLRPERFRSLPLRRA